MYMIIGILDVPCARGKGMHARWETRDLCQKRQLLFLFACRTPRANKRRIIAYFGGVGILDIGGGEDKILNELKVEKQEGIRDHQQQETTKSSRWSP